MDSEDSSANWRFTMKAAVIHLRWYILPPAMKRFIFGLRVMVRTSAATMACR